MFCSSSPSSSSYYLLLRLVHGLGLAKWLENKWMHTTIYWARHSSQIVNVHLFLRIFLRSTAHSALDQAGTDWLFHFLFFFFSSLFAFCAWDWARTENLNGARPPYKLDQLYAQWTAITVLIVRMAFSASKSTEDALATHVCSCIARIVNTESVHALTMTMAATAVDNFQSHIAHMQTTLSQMWPLFLTVCVCVWVCVTVICN